MSNSSFSLFPILSLYFIITCYKSPLLKAVFFNHYSLYLTLFDLYTSVIFTRDHHQVKTWSLTDLCSAKSFSRAVSQSSINCCLFFWELNTWPLATDSGLVQLSRKKIMHQMQWCHGKHANLRFARRSLMLPVFCKKYFIPVKRCPLWFTKKCPNFFVYYLSQQLFDHFMFTSDHIWLYFHTFQIPFSFSYILLFLIYPV